MANRSEGPIPADLLELTLDDLYAEESKDKSYEYRRLLEERDRAQERLEAFMERKRDVTRAIVRLLQEKTASSEQGKAPKSKKRGK